MARLPKSRLKDLKTEKPTKITPRYVGHILHINPDSKNIPCHRVVNSKGKLAEKFAFGGWKEQKRRLMKEGVEFKSEKSVDLVKFQARSL